MLFAMEQQGQIGRFGLACATEVRVPVTVRSLKYSNLSHHLVLPANSGEANWPLPNFHFYLRVATKEDSTLPGHARTTIF